MINNILKYGLKELTKEEAGIEGDNSELNGVFVFIIKGCFQCINLINQLNQQNVDYSDWKFVQVLGNLSYFGDDMELEDMPTTRVYSNGIIVWEMFGVLYPTQIKKLLKQIKHSKL